VDRLACVLAWFRQSAGGCQKIPEDLARYRAILRALRPAVVVETGTGSGHSALWFANQGCRVVTVDVEPWVDELTVEAWAGRVTQIVGDSVAPGTVEFLTGAVGDADPIIVSLDSDHSAGHVREEMELYAAVVTPGSYTVLGWMPIGSPPRSLFDGTPMEAVEDFLEAHDDWGVDTGIEGLCAATQHPGGWLRRLA
jgi:cephalosporin hydroxylase